MKQILIHAAAMLKTSNAKLVTFVLFTNNFKIVNLLKWTLLACRQTDLD